MSYTSESNIEPTPTHLANRTSRSAVVLLLAVAVVATMLLGFMFSPAAAVPGAHASLAAPTHGAKADVASSSLPSTAPLPRFSEPMKLPTMTTPKLGHFTIHGPRPSSWGPSGVPPGAGALLPPAAPHTGSGWGSSGSPGTTWNNRLCSGLWPGFDNVWGVGPQSAYASQCYGHDEPGIQFYSTLPGSGGNVTWNVTLPVDRSPTLNQSDLYAAVWFGMTLTDPFGWLNQCYLELQFYPDQTFYNPGPLFPNWTVNGAWIGAAVGWQLEASTGFEDPCFYEPLYLNGVPGPSYLNMTQGDNIVVKMSGYIGDPYGENLSIIDQTNSQGSNLTLYNSAQGYPLDPSYSTNAFPGSLEWTPGGEYPVTFAFETGHAGNYNWPSNNSYGGCSGGAVSTPSDPGAPCPSYDPGSWANDSLAPWKIQTPTFFNQKSTETPVQVAFTQPEGGISLVDQTSNGACSGIEGSAWCSYPWYSYYCKGHLFEFGATDYPGVANDFGQYTQFDPNSQANPLGFGYYPPTNFSVPSCGSGSTVHVGTAGAVPGHVEFLSHDYTSVTKVKRLLNGEYSIHAVAAAGGFFGNWATSGGVSVASATSAWTSIIVKGPGSVKAVFTTLPKLTVVKFKDAPSGSVGLTPTFTFAGNGTGLATIASGSTYSLAPGIYGLQAYPAPGYNFTSWSVSGAGATVAAPGFPATWIIIDGSAAKVTVTANYVASASNDTLSIYVIGSGSVTVGNLTVSNFGYGYGFGYATMPVGSYATTITPAPGTVNTQILYGVDVVLTNYSLSTQLSLENGSGLFEVIFTGAATLTLLDTPAPGGDIAVAGASSGPGIAPNGGTMSLAPGYYTLSALASSDFTFVDWTTNNSGLLYIYSPTSVETTIYVFASANVTAHYLKVAHGQSVTFKLRPGGSGTVVFNGLDTYSARTLNATVGGGQYIVQAFPAAGFAFRGWISSSANINFVTSPFTATAIITVSGHGTLTAVFAPALYQVTFVVYDSHGVAVPGARLVVAHHHLLSGESVWLTAGATAIRLVSTHALIEWSPSLNLAVASSTSSSTTLTVSGSGTISAMI
ncbi:MAG: hypothetical protein L3K09_01020 [Thermoplasmata archaeon]|nr:hypothetical protein [Thermoplasmata archaeon]